MTNLKPAGDYSAAAVEHAHRPGMVMRLVLLALVLLATAAAFVWFRNDLENELVLGILGVLAMAGIFFIVSAVIGFVEITREGQLTAAGTYQPFAVYITVAAIYFAMCFPLSQWSRSIERKLDVAR